MYSIEEAPEVVHARRVQELVAESVGTMFLVMTIVMAGFLPDGYIAIGSVLLCLVFSFAHISGAHFNPAVTLAHFVSDPGSFGVVRLLGFVVVQVLGGMIGGLLAFAIAGSSNLAPFTPDPDLRQPLASAWAAEFLYSFALCVVVMQVGAKNEEEPNSYFALAVGFTVLGGASAVGKISGGVFNPAVGTAVDFTSLLLAPDNASRLWIYWSAPPAAAVVAGLVNRAVVRSLAQEDKEHAEFEQAARIAAERGEMPPENVLDRRLPIRAVVAEALGTFFLTITVAFGAKPLAIGAILAAMVYAVDHICGADFNPAVSLGVLLRYGIFVEDWWKPFVVALAQVLGGVAAGMLAWGVRGRASFPGENGAEGSIGAFAFEAIWTALLVFVVCTSTTPTAARPGRERTGHARSYHGLAIGLTFAAGVYCAGQSGSGSGGVFNPALGTGIGVAALTEGDPKGALLWIYWAAPLIGALLGGGLYAVLHTHDEGEFAAEAVSRGEILSGYTHPEDDLAPPPFELRR